MGDEKDAFYLVRRGDVVGVYRSLSDVQALTESSVSGPSLSVYKGYSLSQEAQNHLSLHGLRNSSYAIDANNLQEDLFGSLVPCPFREPNSSSESKSTVKEHAEIKPQYSCILEFDGASKGNPGRAGAGAILRSADGTTVFRLREGVGVATCNVAEYRAVILGLKYALQKGFLNIRVQGDSKLVCMQIQGLWKTKTPSMAELCKVAKELKDRFITFQISHVERAYNAEADAQANLAVLLKAGEIQVECDSGQNSIL